MSRTPSRTPVAPFAAPDSERNRTSYLLNGPESTPGTCLAAVQLGRQELDRNPYRDTLPLALQTDTLLPVVQALGRVCLSPFTASTVHNQDLESLMYLAIQLGDSAQAMAALTRWVAAPQEQPADHDETPLETRAKRLNTAVYAYLDRRSPSLSFGAALASVQILLHQLDALGPAARRWQLDARAVTILAQLDEATRTEQWLPAQTLRSIMAFWPRIDEATPAERPNSSELYSLLRQLIDAYGFTNPHGVTTFYDSLRTASPAVAQADTEHLFFSVVGSLLRQELLRLNKAGMVAPALNGTYWYYSSASALSDTVWPQAGRLSLLIMIANELNTKDTERFAGLMRRLAAQYGVRGLSITIATKTHGYWVKNGLQTGPVTPPQEAADDSVYYLNYLRLPATLVVVSTTHVRDAEGRLRQQAPIQFESAYGGGNMVVLADRTGHILLTSDLQIDETRLTAYISRALGISQTVP